MISLILFFSTKSIESFAERVILLWLGGLAQAEGLDRDFCRVMGGLLRVLGTCGRV
jgi:hypothetical protein